MVYVRKVNLPLTVHGAVSVDADGDYSVYINARLPEQIQKSVWEHEKAHIKEDHFYDDIRIVQELEEDAETWKSKEKTEHSMLDDGTILFLRKQGAVPTKEQVDRIGKLLKDISG